MWRTLNHRSSFIADTHDELLREVLVVILDGGTVAPRGSRTRELLVPRLVLTNPRARLLASSARAADYGFAVGEFLWYLSGRDDLATMAYYNRRMPSFSDDGVTLNSAYGAMIWGAASDASRIHRSSARIDQWDVAVRTIVGDLDTRRAVIAIDDKEFHYSADGVGIVPSGRDVPCTLTMQFLVREGRLHLHVNMRSNDVFWGMAYDIFSFTLLQELMLGELRDHGLDIELGWYYHTVGSLHLYVDRHEATARKIIEERVEATPMDPLGDDWSQFAPLLDDERALRLGEVSSIEIEPYSGVPRWMVERLNEHREKRDNETAAKQQQ